MLPKLIYDALRPDPACVDLAEEIDAQIEALLTIDEELRERDLARLERGDRRIDPAIIEARYQIDRQLDALENTRRRLLEPQTVTRYSGETEDELFTWTTREKRFPRLKD